MVKKKKVIKKKIIKKTKIIKKKKKVKQKLKTFYASFRLIGSIPGTHIITASNKKEAIEKYKDGDYVDEIDYLDFDEEDEDEDDNIYEV